MNLSWKTCFKVGLSMFILYLSIHYWTAVSQFFGKLLGAAVPLILGGVTAYIVNILMSFYERRYFPGCGKQAVVKSRRGVCMVGAFLTLFVVVILIVLLIVPQLSSCVQLILSELPDLLSAAVVYVDGLGILPEDIMAALESIDWQSSIGQILQVVTSGLGNVMDVLFTAVSSVFSVVVTALFSLIFSIYILIGKENLSRQARKLTTRYMRPSWNKKLYYVLNVLNDSFHQFIVGQCIEALILGLLCTIGMLILRLPYATMIGALIAFTALIPVAGAYIGAAVGAFMILTVSPIKALIFLIFLVILQQLEGNLIYPKVVGSSMGLPGIWVLAAVTIGGGVMGIPGMLLGVPLAAACYKLLSRDVNKKGSPAKKTA